MSEYPQPPPMPNGNVPPPMPNGNVPPPMPGGFVPPQVPQQPVYPNGQYHSDDPSAVPEERAGREEGEPELPNSESNPFRAKKKICPNCGTEMVFDPQSSSLKCPSCGTIEQVDHASDLVKEDFQATLRRLAAEAEYGETEEAIVVVCPGCGAQVTLPPNVTAENCSYCGMPLTAQRASCRQIKPSALLPFKVSSKKAMELYQQWLGSRWFMPNNVKHEMVEHRLEGCFIPHWLYDTEAETEYTGERGEYYYVTEEYTTRDSNGKMVTRTRQVRKTRWYPAYPLQRFSEGFRRAIQRGRLTTTRKNPGGSPLQAR